MIKIRNKRIALLLVFAMLATMFIGVGTASARSLNSTNKVLSIGDTYSSTTAGAPLGVAITIQEDSDYKSDFAVGDSFELQLPSGVKWVAAQTTVNVYNATAATTTAATLNYRTDQVLEVKIPAASVGTGQDIITVIPGIDLDGFAGGDLALTINGLDSAITSGSVVFATVGTSSAGVTVSSVEKVSKGSAQAGGTIAIRESSVGSIGVGASTITLKLPANYEWDPTFITTDITFGGGLATAGVAGAAPTVALTATGSRSITATITTASASASRGTIYINPAIKVGTDAAKGDVSVNVSGTKPSGSSICDTDIVIAEYVDWGTTSSIASVKELKAGRFEVETDEITIAENMVGSLVNNRTLTITVPDDVLITDVSTWTTPTGSLAATIRPVPDGKNSYVDFTIANAGVTKGKLKFKLELSIKANKTGDIEATISGAGATEQKLVIAKAVQPATIAATSTDLIVGLQSQAISDITITEGVKEGAAYQTYTTSGAGAARKSDGKITVTLTDGVVWAATPTVTVTSGDLELKDISTADGVLTMNVKSDSTKPSTIAITKGIVTLNRSVPEGPIYAKMGGSAVNENSKAALGFAVGASLGTGNSATVDAGEFDLATVQKVQIGQVVTPASDITTYTSAFVVGASKYTLNGKEVNAFAASYIKNDRTYLAIRDIASAIGIDQSNVIWDGTKNTVTLMKGDKVVQMTIGSKTLLINGAAVSMDVAPEVGPGDRTMLPAAFVAMAFGSTASFDAATNTVTIK